MRRLRLALLLPLAALALAACGCDPVDGPDGGTDAGAPDGTDAGADGGEVSLRDELGIATFNVQMLFDTECQSGRCDPWDFEKVPSQAELEAKAVELAEGIRALQADVVLLQEVENEAALEALQAELADRYPVALVGEQGWPASMDVALLSALPVKAIRRHQDQRLPLPDGGSTTFTREFLEVHLEAGGGRTVVVFVAHFKAKANDDPARRLAEATAAADIVAAAVEARPDALVVLGGDLNDVPGSPPLEVLTGDGELRRVASELDRDGTYLYRGTWQAIDHLLLHPEGAGDHVPGTSEVLCNAGVAGFAGSDHCALRADFRLR